MARAFNGTTDKILMSLGAIPTGPTNMTFAAIVNIGATSRWNNMLCLATSADANVADMTINGTTNELTYEAGANTRATVTSIGTGWQLLAITKAAGTTAPKGHRYVYSTGVWTHTASGSTIGNPSGTVARPYLGTIAAGDFLQGDLAANGFWDRSLSDAEIELLPYTLQSWVSLAPKALWLLDQADTAHKIIDITGGGANENTLTGTTVSANSVPLFNYADGIWLPTHAASGSSNGGVTAPAGDLVLSANVPTVSGSGVVVSPAGNLVLGGDTPTLRNAVTAPVGLLTLVGDAPTFRADNAFAAPAGALTLGGSAPIITAGPAAPAGALVLGAAAPTLREDNIFAAPAGSLVLAGLVPTINTGTGTTVEVESPQTYYGR